MKRTWAFSLVEILIVISIIAILASIAMVQYQTYSMRAKIAQGMTVLNNIGSMSKAYYDTNGVFPNLQQIGLSHDISDPTQSPMANSLDDYIADYVAYTFLVDQAGSYSCPTVSYGGYISNLVNDDFLTGSQAGTFINVVEMLVYVNNTYENYCQYYFMRNDPTNGMTPVSGDYITNCVNGTDDPNAANYFTDAGNQCS